MRGKPLVEEVVVAPTEDLLPAHDSPTLSLNGLDNSVEDALSFHASSPCSSPSPNRKKKEKKKKKKVEDLIAEELDEDPNTSLSSCEEASEEFNGTSTSSGIGVSLDASSTLGCCSSSSDEQTQKRLNISHMLQVMKERLNVSDNDRDSNHDNPGLRSYLLNTSWLCTSQSEDSESVSDLSVSTGDGFEEFYKRYRCNEIQKELKLMTLHHQDGVYVAPSLKSIEMWFGVMFIRDGPYKDGIFHFTVYFSDDFPEDGPTLKFKSPVFHPQIKSRKGTLNLGPMYSAKSKDTRVFVWEIIKYARSCFYHLNVTDAYNPEAAHIFQTDLKTFKARCRNSVLDSLLEFEEQKHALDHQSENPFRGTIIENGLCNAVRKALTCAEREEVGKNGLFGWARSQLGRMLNNIHASYDGTEQII